MSETLTREQFDFTGGHPALDFVNTKSDRLDETPKEWLKSFDDLLTWGRQGDIVGPNDTARLRKEAAQHEQEASEVLKRAITLREAIFRIYEQFALSKLPDQADVDILDAELKRARSHLHLVVNNEDCIDIWDIQDEDLDAVLWSIAKSAAELIASSDRRNVRICEAEDCAWLFLDTSKNHSRRWCNMQTCGNRAKARKHYQKKSQPATHA